MNFSRRLVTPGPLVASGVSSLISGATSLLPTRAAETVYADAIGLGVLVRCGVSPVLYDRRRHRLRSKVRPRSGNSCKVLSLTHTHTITLSLPLSLSLSLSLSLLTQGSYALYWDASALKLCPPPQKGS